MKKRKIIIIVSNCYQNLKCETLKHLPIQLFIENKDPGEITLLVLFIENQTECHKYKSC